MRCTWANALWVSGASMPESVTAMRMAAPTAGNVADLPHTQK